MSFAKMPTTSIETEPKTSKPKTSKYIGTIIVPNINESEILSYGAGFIHAACYGLALALAITLANTDIDENAANGAAHILTVQLAIAAALSMIIIVMHAALAKIDRLTSFTILTTMVTALNLLEICYATSLLSYTMSLGDQPAFGMVVAILISIVFGTSMTHAFFIASLQKENTEERRPLGHN